MPVYEYRRPDGTTFEILQKFSDDALTHDPETGVPVFKVFSAPAIHFKGKGFHNTDYGTKKRPVGGGAEGGSEGGGSEGGSGSESSSTGSSSEGGTTGSDSKSTSSEASSGGSSSSSDGGSSSAPAAKAAATTGSKD